MGGETASARDSQVTYLIDGAFEEYARRLDPNAATLPQPTDWLRLHLAVTEGGAVRVEARRAPSRDLRRVAFPTDPFPPAEQVGLGTVEVPGAMPALDQPRADCSSSGVGRCRGIRTV